MIGKLPILNQVLNLIQPVISLLGSIFQSIKVSLHKILTSQAIDPFVNPQSNKKYLPKLIKTGKK